MELLKIVYKENTRFNFLTVKLMVLSGSIVESYDQILELLIQNLYFQVPRAEFVNIS